MAGFDRRGSRRALIVLLVGTQLVFGAAAAARDDGAPRPSAGTIAALRATSDGPVRIESHAATGAARLVGAAAGHTLGRPEGVAPTDPPETAARAFVTEHRRAFGLEDAERELETTSTTPTRDGGRTVRFQQVHGTLPVVGAQLAVRVDADNHVLSVAGEIHPSPAVDDTPALAAPDARDLAIAVAARQREVDEAVLEAGPTDLVVFDTDLLGGPPRPGAHLAWQVEVSAPALPWLRDRVLLDADSGAVLARIPLAFEAKDRVVCDNAEVVQPENPLKTCGTTLPVARGETDPAVAEADVNEAWTLSGQFYDFLDSRLDRDSFDGTGGALRSTVRWCDTGSACPMGNAFWSGTAMYYGTGFVVDDVVAHEFAHGLTQHTSNLLYYYQSGAINESYSDLYGELFDLVTTGDDDVTNRWLIGEETTGGPIRDLANPPAFGDPDRMGSPNYHTASTDSGGVHSNSGVMNKAIYLLVDGDTFNSVTVAPIGLDATLQVFYEAQTSLLTSASDYADLADALEQACDTLVGSNGITAADCDEVAKAVIATEMRDEPPGPGTLDAARCANGADLVVPLFADDVEATPSAWSNASVTNGKPWLARFDYATSGTTAFFGENADTTGIADLELLTAIELPGNAHLRFSHAHEFEPPNWDAGVVEYTTDDGASWLDAGPLFTVNGYTAGTVSSGDTNPLGGRNAFLGTSAGYTTSRVDLSTLAAETVRFRWRIGTDSFLAWFGWFVDDVEVYACDADTPTFGAGPLDATGTTDTTTSLAWPAATDDVEVTGYRVDLDGEELTTVDAASTTLDVAGLEPATSHAFRVSAIDTAGRISSPLEQTVLTPDTIAPVFPSGARLTTSDQGTNAVTLTWPAATDAVGVDHYRLEGTPAGPTTLAGELTSTRVTGLEAGATDTFALRAVDAAGNVSTPLTTSASTLIPLEVVRMAGANRYETAALVSADRFRDGAPTVFVATGANFPDALAAGPAAGLAGAPILLVTDTGIPDVTAQELSRLAPDRIVILGGEAVVPPAVAQLLQGYAAQVDRLAGDNRYGTAVEVSRSAFSPGVPVVYVATGSNFPDAVAGAAAAGHEGGPILLVGRDTIPTEVADELTRLAPGRIVILGGDAAVAAAVEADLAAFTSGSVERLRGADRYMTAASIGATFPAGIDEVYIATGRTFPDALTGTPPAVVVGAPVLLVPPDAIPEVVAAQLDRIGPRRIIVLGGEGVIGPAVGQALTGFLG